MKLNIRTNAIEGLLIAMLLFINGIVIGNAKDADYPTKPISVYIPFAEGGTTGLVVRPLADAAAKILGQPFVLVYKPGGAGVLCGVTVMNSAPDGYSLGIIASGWAFVAPFSEEAPYKDLSRLSMIMNFGGNLYAVMVRDDSPWNTWKEFIDWAKHNPRAAKIGVPGGKTVTSQGLVFGQVEMRENVVFTYVPLKGSADILTNILGGHINVFGSTIDSGTMQYVKEGKLRILTYLAKEKIPGYENIPSLHELYGFSLPNMLGFVGPKGIPEDIRKKLEDALCRSMNNPEFIRAMNQVYAPIIYMDSVKMKQFVDDTLRVTSPILKTLKASEVKK
jgi:tripartite-type tricarboxylate transporter receptor subunit TctC